ncbi:MAG TPA: DUF1573 domain-containing protein [Bacteroidia bacterium]|nr:DUF1573 domain-containing protein [Bacteroidia bacterium]
MKKVFLTSAIILIALFNTIAQTAKSTDKIVDPNAPVIVFETDVHDFGTINQNDNGTYEFKFTNTGKEPLVISNAHGSCGCTVPSWPKDPIAPGKQAVIKVTYDTHRIGTFVKTVTLQSNANPEQKVLTIKGKVVAVPASDIFPGTKNDAAAPYSPTEN